MRAFGAVGNAAGFDDMAEQAEIGKVETHWQDAHPSYSAKSGFKYC